MLRVGGGWKRVGWRERRINSCLQPYSVLSMRGPCSITVERSRKWASGGGGGGGGGGGKKKSSVENGPRKEKEEKRKKEKKKKEGTKVVGPFYRPQFTECNVSALFRL